jgi:Na+-transporting methylmalonyl-CoA/oxaloacetate decarboxylase gamma subunit
MLLSTISLGTAGITALLGYAIVFFGLILLMIVVMIIGKCFTAKKTVKTEEAPAPAAEPAPVAPGTAGGVKLYNVEPKTAAMLMAIVADKLQMPLNELRFISIKEVEQ